MANGEEQQFHIPSESLRPNVEKLLQFLQHTLKLPPLEAVITMREAERVIKHRTGLDVGEVTFREDPTPMAAIIPIFGKKDSDITQ